MADKKSTKGAKTKGKVPFFWTKRLHFQGASKLIKLTGAKLIQTLNMRHRWTYPKVQITIFADLFRIWEMPSHHLEILCGNCRAFIIRYRKEGSGQLGRIYLDRITKPSSIAKLKSTSVKSDLPPLICPDCQNCMGLPMRHEGGRLAYRIIKGSFRRKEAK